MFLWNFPRPHWPVACGRLRHHPQRRSPVLPPGERVLHSCPVPHPPSPAVVLWEGPAPLCRPAWLLAALRYEPARSLTIANSHNRGVRPLCAQKWVSRQTRWSPVNGRAHCSPLASVPTVNAAWALCDMSNTGARRLKFRLRNNVSRKCSTVQTQLSHWGTCNKGILSRSSFTPAKNLSHLTILRRYDHHVSYHSVHDDNEDDVDWIICDTLAHSSPLWRKEYEWGGVTRESSLLIGRGSFRIELTSFFKTGNVNSAS